MRNVSVIMCVKDAKNYVGDCIRSLLDQTFKNFEIILIDDGSRDGTDRVIAGFRDERIRVFRNVENLGITKSRNKGLKLSCGEYIFFTDSDCIVTQNWIEQGLRMLREPDCAGVEGKIYYVSKEYEPTFSDHVSKNENGHQYMTGNIAYKRSFIDRVGGFDERYTYHEDRDLALRILEIGRICFNADMIVHVQKQKLTYRDVIREARHIKNRVYLFKKFGDIDSMLWRIVRPFNLAKILFPPLVFASLLFNKFKTSADYELLPFKYAYSILERVNLWKTCAVERVFLI